MEKRTIPQISDVILLLYREAYYRGDPLRYGDLAKYMEYITELRNSRGDAEVIVAKHPSVAVLPTTVHLTFNPTEGFLSAF